MGRKGTNDTNKLASTYIVVKDSFKKIDVFASYTYQYGLTDIYKAKTSSNRKSRRISNIISLGVAYKF